MENKDLKIAILNLTGELHQELSDYFVQRGVKVVDPLVSQEKLAWTHILTKDIHDFSLLRKTYGTLEKDIKIISLTLIDDPQNFILANGKLVLDEVWMKGELGSFILDKFFQEYAGITLGDNYPKFEEKGSFNITNPFSTGDYLDRMVQHAFQGDFAALSVKTYFDHILMYLTGLKKLGKVGLPIEVTYGTFENVFGLQIHFFADGLMLDDITNCLTGKITKKAEEYLLNVSVQSSDFFDFTFLSQVKKVVITSLWTKDERVKMENRGLMFTSLNSAASVQSLSYEGVTSQLDQNEALEDMTSKVILPEVEENQAISGDDLNESLAEQISSDMDMDQIKEILSGNVADDPDKIVLGSSEEMEELVTLVKGTLEEEEESFKISGGKRDIDNFAVRISAGIVEKGKGNLSVKSLGDKLPGSIKKGLFDFAVKIGKDVDDLSDSEIQSFKSIEIPQIIKNETVVGNKISKQLRDELKSKLEQSLKSEFMEDSTDGVFSSLKTPEDEKRVKDILKSTLKSSLESSFQLGQKDNISESEKNLLVKSLNVSLSEDEDKVRDIVIKSSREEKQLFAPALSEAEKKLKLQLDAAQVENDSLKNKMKTLMVEVKILKESRSQITAMQGQAKETAEALANKQKVPDKDADLRKHFQQRLSQEEVLGHEEQKKLSMLMEREVKLIEAVKEKELEARKIQLESVQKEFLFTQELEKANRQIKTRDLMLDKTKEGLQKLSAQKDSQILSLQLKLDNLSQVLSAGPSQAQLTQIRDLERQNQNLEKMAEMYKVKVSSMVNSLQSNKDDDGMAKEEVRRMQMINNQLKNQVDAGKKEIQKFQDKIAYDMGQIASVRKEKANLEQLMKKLTQEMKKEKSLPQVNEFEGELKKAKAQNQQLENQFRDVTIKLKEAETRLSESMKNANKQTNVEDSSKKVAHLESNVKKLTQDLIESRNQSAELKKETNKLRQDKTAIQNQLDRMKKDADKASKAASAQKPDSGGKAA